MSTLIMVRTSCCESYKDCGTRCSICPDRPENAAAVRECEAACDRMALGRRCGRVEMKRIARPAMAAESARAAAV